MALPLAAPLISLGFEIIDKFFDKDDDKISNKDKLLRLEAEGKIHDLQKEVERLRDITSVDTTSNRQETDLITRPSILEEPANLAWKDKLGTVVSYAFGLDLIARPLFNQGVEMFNAYNETGIMPMMGALSGEQMAAAIGVLVGVGGIGLMQNKMASSTDKIKQWFGK